MERQGGREAPRGDLPRKVVFLTRPTHPIKIPVAIPALARHHQDRRRRRQRPGAPRFAGQA